MKRFLVLSFLLWASLFVCSSMAFAVTTEAEAWNFCQSELNSYSGSTSQTPICHIKSTSLSFVTYDLLLNGTYYYQNSWAFDASCTETLYQDSQGIWQCGNPPSDCISPNYIDVVSGECLPPEEICYTNLEEMADQCVLIGKEDPDPNLNCVTDETGKTLCLDDNPLCYTIDGVTACPEPDNVCGWKNGTYNCLDPVEEGCGYFNGEKVCTTPDGDIVDPASPDHPDNGGNMDGNDSNDVTDPRDPTTEGGDPTNQPDSGSTDGSTEKTSKLSLAELQKLTKSGKASAAALQKMASEGIKTNLEEELTQGAADSIIQNGASGSWDDPATGTWATVDGHADSIGAEGGQNYGVDMVMGIGTTTKNLIPQGTCQNLGFTFKGHVFGLPCDKTKKIRDLMSWVFYLLTAWFLFDIITSPATRQK